MRYSSHHAGILIASFSISPETVKDIPPFFGYSVLCKIVISPHFSSLDANSISFREPSTQQSTWYDLSLVLGAETKYSDLAACWESLNLAELESAKVVDTYEKDGMKSIAVRLVFSAMDRTLEMEEVQGWIDTVIANLGKIGVTLRA